MGATGFVKIAIVLFNLGAPDSLEAVGPFLRNLFSDPAILRVPRILRPLLAGWISRRRTPEAQNIYAKIGGGSPLLSETQRQAEALASRLNDRGDDSYGVFIAMRYWHPLIPETVTKVEEFAPDRIVLVPLYPQYSSTTTASSMRAWQQAAKEIGLSRPTNTVCCYPEQAEWVECQTQLLASTIAESGENLGGLRILFSAHGLPKRIVDAGDPYPDHVERTAKRIINSILHRNMGELDWVVCYQSKVGPLEWIGPSTESEIVRAGRDQKSVVIAPISFVSEHSETLVELDMTFRDLAERSGVRTFHRVPAAGVHLSFISGLVAIVDSALARETKVDSAPGGRVCAPGISDCPCPTNRAEAPP